MSLLHLRSFVEVYRQRSFSAAARSLRLTQPAVSQHVAALESAIGHALFERQAKGVVPTPSADELAAGLGDRLERAEAAFAQIRARSADLTGMVRIMGHGDFIAEVVMPRLLPLLAQGMRLRLISGDREDIRSALADGDCDLALSAYPIEDRRFRSEVVHEETLHAVASPEVAARMSAAPSLSAALEQEPLLAFNLEQQVVEDWLTTNKLPQHVAQPAMIGHDLRCLRKMLGLGFGWSVLPGYLCHEAIAAGELVEVPAPKAVPVNRYHLIWPTAALREPRVALARSAIRESLGSA